MLNLLGALMMGLIVGYERTYLGRAAGMRTYGLVCMASAAIVIVSGYPQLCYGGLQGVLTIDAAYRDPTRSIQGIVTGIGFLGAGVIMKEGLSISGLTTAAPLWASAAIGIMVGIGFYPAAIFFALSVVACMTLVSKFEQHLPSRPAIAVMLRFQRDFRPNLATIDAALRSRGYLMASGSIAISQQLGQAEWHFIVLASNNSFGAVMPQLSLELQILEGVVDLSITHARN